MKRTKFFITLITLFTVIHTHAQPFEIRAVNKGNGVIGVEMRVTGGTAPTTASFITDLVFGLKWLASYNVDLSNTITTTYNIKKSDVRKQKNNFNYQAFFVDQTPQNFPASWTLNNWVEIMSIANTKTGQGLGDFAIAENGFDITTNPNIGVNLVDYSPLITAVATDVILPVKITSFNASATENCVVNIIWQTSQEVNASYYSVERSDNGRTFYEVARTKAAGNSATALSYSFADNDAPAGKLFYRLRVVDKNDKYGYSGIIETTNCRGRNSVVVYPTLSNGILNVKLPPGFERAMIRIINGAGEVVIEDETKTLVRIISLKKEANGPYMVQVVNSNKVIDNVKVILQH
ncbi:MAG TPA: hypothetical protein VM884_07085 [Flavisolibacter sp.]|nr:hypothetical protein [Flavisolibacter sp.]